MAEKLYVGPRFETVFLSRKSPDYEDITQLMKWCTHFNTLGLTPVHESGTSGNLSFRIKSGENAFCITGAGLIAKSRLNYSDFVEVSNCDIFAMKVFAKGTRFPSSESLMHFAIYEQLPNINAVFHGHHEWLLKNAYRLKIHITDIACEYGTPELIASIMPMLEKHNFFIIREHGFLSVGTDMDEAGNLAVAIVS